jgi:DNA-binding transcriptional regulator LsrR (DeoR family)
MRLLVKVAQLYHLQGLNQDQIGRQVGVSRSKVSRMLKEARERGLVEISIHYPARFSLDLERRLESELGLREAVVVNAGGAAARQGISSVAAAASDYLLRVLRPGDVLGVSGGETISTMSRLMPDAAIDKITVVQLGTAVAYLGDQAAFSSAEVALQVAQKLGSMERLVLIPVPFILDSESIRDALLRDTGVRRAIARLARCSVAVVGIGALDARTTRGQVLPVSDTELAEIRDVGAAGEICTRFFDEFGQACMTSLDRRMVAIDLTDFRAVPLVIGVAAGKHKAAAILGAVRGGYIKSLVTDDATAKQVLAMARAPSDNVEMRARDVSLPAGN